MSDGYFEWTNDLPVCSIMNTPEQGFPEAILHDLSALEISPEQKEVQCIIELKDHICFAYERAQTTQKVSRTRCMSMQVIIEGTA